MDRTAQIATEFTREYISRFLNGNAAETDAEAVTAQCWLSFIQRKSK
jgi:hypothetical protein